MTARPETAGFVVRGWHVLAGVVGFFVLVIGVDAAFVVQALRTYPGEVSVTPYEDGLAYNRKIAQVEAQARLGWSAAVAGEPGKVRVEVRDRAGAPVEGLSFTARLQRPATEAGRMDVKLQPAGKGVYTANVGQISGAWDLTVRGADAAGRVFEAERRLMWP